MTDTQADFITTVNVDWHLIEEKWNKSGKKRVSLTPLDETEANYRNKYETKSSVPFQFVWMDEQGKLNESDTSVKAHATFSNHNGIFNVALPSYMRDNLWVLSGGRIDEIQRAPFVVYQNRGNHIAQKTVHFIEKYSNIVFLRSEYIISFTHGDPVVEEFPILKQIGPHKMYTIRRGKTIAEAGEVPVSIGKNYYGSETRFYWIPGPAGGFIVSKKPVLDWDNTSQAIYNGS